MKKQYIQPEVQVAQIEMESMILSGSAAGMSISDTETSTQW